MQLEQLLSLIAVGAFLGGIGKRITRMVFPYGTRGPWKGWRRFFHLTMWAHPILTGALIGLSGQLPSPPFLTPEGGKLYVAGAIWYSLAGMFSSAAFYRLDSVIKTTGVISRPIVNERITLPAPPEDTEDSYAPHDDTEEE